MTSLCPILLPICCLREFFPDQCKKYLLKENCFVYCFSSDSPLSTRNLSQAVYCVAYQFDGKRNLVIEAVARREFSFVLGFSGGTRRSQGYSVFSVGHAASVEGRGWRLSLRRDRVKMAASIVVR